MTAGAASRTAIDKAGDSTVRKRRILPCCALGLALLPTAPPTGGQLNLEPIEQPLLDHYEQPVQDQLATARAALDRALGDPEANPRSLLAAFGYLGELYLLYDLMTPAGAALRNANALDPEEARWPYFLAIHSELEGDLEQVVARLDQVISLEPRNSAALTRRGNALIELARTHAAEADFRRVLDSDPNHSAALAGIGRTALRRGEYARAAEHFRKALAGQPTGSVVHHHLGRALRGLGLREEAEAELRRNQHVRVGFSDPRFKALQRLNVSREAHFNRGTDALYRGDPRGALAAFQAAMRIEPDDPTTLFNVGIALIELGDKNGAADSMRRAIALDHEYRDPHYNLALILAERSDFEGAERHFRRASEIDSGDLEARVRRADALTRLGREEEAIEVLFEVLAADPAMPIAQLGLGAAYQAADAPDEARSSLAEVLKAAPGAPRERAEAHYRLAVLAAASSRGGGDLLEPVEHLRKAIALDPNLADAHALLGNLLARQEAFAEAARHFGRALARDPSNVGWHRDRAMAQILGRRYAAARSGLLSARGTLANSAGADTGDVAHLETLLARLLAASPDPQVRNGAEALAIAQRLMAAHQTVEHAETMAMALAEMGEFEQAAELQRQILGEIERRGVEPTQGQAERLRSYLDRTPVREPWFHP